MKKILPHLLAIILVCGFSSPAVAQQYPPQSPLVVLPRSETNFIKAAAEDSLFEMKMGQLAVVKAADNQVKMFGESMVDTHSEAIQQLQALARQNNVELPQVMGPEHQRLYDAFSKLKSNEFDEKYTKLMVGMHRIAVAEFEREQFWASDPALKKWVSDTLPLLRSNFQKAKEIADLYSNHAME